MAKKLTHKQRRFVEAYTGECHGNATEAYKRAGYSWGTDATARVESHKLLTNPNVSSAIASATQEVSSRAIATRQERQELLTRILRGEETEVRLGSGGALVGTTEFVVPVTAKDRLKALELLGRMQGDFVERHEHSGPGGGPISHASFTELLKAAQERAGGDDE